MPSPPRTFGKRVCLYLLTLQRYSLDWRAGFQPALRVEIHPQAGPARLHPSHPKVGHRKRTRCPRAVRRASVPVVRNAVMELTLWKVGRDARLNPRDAGAAEDVEDLIFFSGEKRAGFGGELCVCAKTRSLI